MTVNAAQIASNLERVRAQVAQAARAAGRDPDAVRLVAVSKRHPPEAIAAAYAAGQRDFGENYAQELRDKARALAHLEGIRWHFIGPVQSNKAKYLAAFAHVVHCVDAPAVADALSRRVTAAGRAMDVLLQVNVGADPNKSGCAPDQVADLARYVAGCPGLRPVGLMTILPFGLEAEQNRALYRELARLRGRVAVHLRGEELSMGMSDDFAEAVAEGATMVRIGTAIFGERS